MKPQYLFYELVWRIVIGKLEGSDPYKFKRSEGNGAEERLVVRCDIVGNPWSKGGTLKPRWIFHICFEYSVMAVFIIDMGAMIQTKLSGACWSQLLPPFE